ncbi:MAG: hypothetical protein J6U82_05625 [Alistipes sp.]|nr:hypothetical protein [Alistipes sp.]
MTTYDNRPNFSFSDINLATYKNKQNLADGVSFWEKVITFTLKMFHLLIVTAAATYRKLNKNSNYTARLAQRMMGFFVSNIHIYLLKSNSYESNF